MASRIRCAPARGGARAGSPSPHPPRLQDMAYAEVDGREVSVVRSEDGGTHAVSWSLQHDDAATGVYTVDIHTSAARAGTPATSVTVDHTADSFTLPVSVEKIAGAAALAWVVYVYLRPRK